MSQQKDTKPAPNSGVGVDAIVIRRSLSEEKRLIKELTRFGWSPHLDKWISPYTLIDYNFEQALQIENLSGV